MSTIDPDEIPPTPVYTITLTSSGTATVDGERVSSDGGTPEAARRDALAEVRIKAALHGRPVRALAKEPDGSAWPIIVGIDGTVTTLTRPHPTPAPPPAPMSAQVPAGPSTAPPVLTEWATVTVPVLKTPQRAQAAATRPPVAAEEWAAPLAAEYVGPWRELIAHEKAGRLAEAIITADRIETALTEQCGPLHPDTVNVLTVRAWLTLRQGAQPGEWAEVTELLIDTAERRQEAKAQPGEETARTVRNAHAAWHYMRAQDAETALDLSERLLGLLDGDDRRARDVVQWVASGAARHGVA